MVFNSVLAEIISLAQGLVDNEDQREEDAEAHRPFLMATCVFIAGPHHATPSLKDLHDALALDFEEGELDLSLYTSCCRARGEGLAEIVLYHVFGFFIEDEASFEDCGGYVDFEGLSEEFTLLQSVLKNDEGRRWSSTSLPDALLAQ